MLPRAAVLDDAKAAICGDRNNTYGEPTQDFSRTAGVLNALGYRGPDNQPLQPHDVAVIISGVKLSRLMWSPEHRDSWVDLAGYAACGYECVVADQDTNNGENENASTEEDDGCAERCPACQQGGPKDRADYLSTLIYDDGARPIGRVERRYAGRSAG